MSYQFPTRSPNGGQNDNVFAEFFTDAVHLPFRSSQEGRPIYEDREHVKIFIAGDARTEIVREATDEDRQRFPGAYDAFKRGERDAAQSGTPLKQWPEMTPAMIRNFAAQNVFTVEQLAGLSDTQKQHVGMGAREWAEKAKAFIAHAREIGAATHFAAENEKLRSEVEDLKRQISELAARADDENRPARRGR